MSMQPGHYSINALATEFPPSNRTWAKYQWASFWFFLSTRNDVAACMALAGMGLVLWGVAGKYSEACND